MKNETTAYNFFRLSEPVSVVVTSSAFPSYVTPKKILWRGREYKVTKLGLHHVYKQGKTLFHVFSVATESLFMRLVLNTDTLFWKLEEIGENNE